ncbi:MAG: type IA DNA topoisomerase [Lachnospiraceae bacterium]|nr:type IA DNA topoisomerase [Lachnospiraceae bacterium]
MSKRLFIAEKPSVARQFGDALKESFRQGDGFLESDESVVTWCVGHLVTMSYPDAYDEKLKQWRYDTLPFLPREYKYEIIPSAAKQFRIVASLLNRSDVDTIYICTDSGREGEYIYRLVDRMAGVKDKVRKRVWIDSQTEEEILRGIREAKDWSAYDALSNAAYLRAKEDYLMGMNFSRVATLKYKKCVNGFLHREKGAISVGRVMTCVLGIIVAREREIRDFKKTPFYRVLGKFGAGESELSGEWRAAEGSAYYQSPKLYKENGFKERVDAEALMASLEGKPAVIREITRKKETKNPPLLYNLAELQNDCSKYFKISPDQTLAVVQELYEKKLTTYPRTDARVLSSAVAKEISKNIAGLKGYGVCGTYAAEVLDSGSWKTIGKSKYTNDKMITDHYAIIPTGQGLGALGSLNDLSAKVYELIVRRFLSIFYPPAVYRKFSPVIGVGEESFFSVFKVLEEEGYRKVAYLPTKDKKDGEEKSRADVPSDESEEGGEAADKDREEQKEEEIDDGALLAFLNQVSAGTELPVKGYEIKEGETSPPKRYTSGSMILTMENAGQFIEDDELRSQIKGSGIGTSATRAEILSKLQKIEYIRLNKKTQVLSPTLLGEMIYIVMAGSMPSMLNPALTASWEKGLTMVAGSEITPEEYMGKLESFITQITNNVKGLNNIPQMENTFRQVSVYYNKRGK